MVCIDVQPMRLIITRMLMIFEYVERWFIAISCMNVNVDSAYPSRQVI